LVWSERSSTRGPLLTRKVFQALIFFLGVAAACTLLVAPFELVIAPSLACSAADAVLGSYILQSLVIASVALHARNNERVLGYLKQEDYFLVLELLGSSKLQNSRKKWWLSCDGAVLFGGVHR
jgi:hypothetical protein